MHESRYLSLLLSCATACMALCIGVSAIAEKPDIKTASLKQQEGSKVALVIGNADYSPRPLRNPVNDAQSVATALHELGFDVTLRDNVDFTQMLDAMRDFWLKSREANVRVFYYAGHGVQYHGENYLLPVDTILKSEDDIPRKAASVNALLDKLKQASTGVNILILDACRTLPFLSTRGRNSSTTRGSENGLAQVVAPQGTLIAFSTAPGAVAYDGAGDNSIYTHRLITHLKTPGLPVEQLFKRVRIDVVQLSKDQQIPWESSSLLGDFCFRTGQTGKCPASEYVGH